MGSSLKARLMKVCGEAFRHFPEAILLWQPYIKILNLHSTSEPRTKSPKPQKRQPVQQKSHLKWYECLAKFPENLMWNNKQYIEVNKDFHQSTNICYTAGLDVKQKPNPCYLHRTARATLSSLLVCLLATLRTYGWTDFHKIFRQVLHGTQNILG